MKKTSKTRIEKKTEENAYLDEDITYSITFNRLNKITIVNGILFIILAIINIPLLYNPELDQITFNVSGKPAFFFGGSLAFYLTAGLLPLIIGIIFITFSLITGRPIVLLMHKDGKARYIKKLGGNLLLDTQVDFQMKGKLQYISLGKRHQRFVIWVTVAIMIYMVFLLSDFMYLLDLSFDITTTFFGMEYSMRWFILINIFYIIGILLPFTLFPRKLCKVETSKALVKFDYVNFNVEKLTDEEVNLDYMEPFLRLEKEQEIKSQGRKNEKIPEGFPDFVKKKVRNGEFSHFPRNSLILGLVLFLIVLLPQFLPNFYLMGFTFSVEYFIIVAAFFYIVGTLQNAWFSQQEVIPNNGHLTIIRENQIFGKSIEHYSQIREMDTSLTPRKPHFLEYIWFFFPFMEIVWVFYNIFRFPVYFFTENLYTILYFLVIIGIFLLVGAIYISPLRHLKVISENQPPTRKKSETFEVYFPEEKVQRNLGLKELISNGKLLENLIAGILLILIPIIAGIIWVILAILGILPSLAITIL
ncbi:MAG: hypothetical protein ACOC44_16125 [Promethearchaeia archaeon]